jgi:hypothetical protein
MRAVAGTVRGSLGREGVGQMETGPGNPAWPGVGSVAGGSGTGAPTRGRPLEDLSSRKWSSSLGAGGNVPCCAHRCVAFSR